MSNETPNPYNPAPVDYSGQASDGSNGTPYGNQYNGQENQVPVQRFNTLSIISFISAFVIPLVAVITGHISLSQIKKTKERGRPLAIWGTVLGYLGMVATIIVTLVIVIGGALAATSVSESIASYSPPAVAVPSVPGVDSEVSKNDSESGTRSPEFCTALDAMTLSSGADTTTSDQVSDELKGLYKNLSEIASPDQATYAAFYDFMANPEKYSGTGEAEVKETVGKLFEVIAKDSMICAMQ